MSSPAWHERVRNWRKARGLSQEALSDRCGWPQPKISRIETGVISANVEDLETIVAALGLTIVQFYGRVPKKRAV